jgi:hypothetical protein
MTLEQLEMLKGVFEQLEDLKYQLKRFENNEFEICVRDPNGHVRYNSLLYDIMKKYKVNIIEDLKNEIKRRETALESISIVQLNKLV